MNVRLFVVAIFLRTLPTNFDETFRVPSRHAKYGTEIFWCNITHKQKSFTNRPILITTSVRMAKYVPMS